jgi:hypothetical protein
MGGMGLGHIYRARQGGTGVCLRCGARARGSMLFLTTFIVFPIVPPHVRIHTPASLAATAAAADRLIDAD